MTEVTRMWRLIFIKYEVFPQCLIRKVYYTASVISMMFLIFFSSTTELSEKTFEESDLIYL